MPITERPCGNPACSVSIGICERLTFGSGYLDDHGYWDYACGICAEAAINKPDSGLTINDVWPCLANPENVPKVVLGIYDRYANKNTRDGHPKK